MCCECMCVFERKCGYVSMREGMRACVCVCVCVSVFVLLRGMCEVVCVSVCKLVEI